VALEPTICPSRVADTLSTTTRRVSRELEQQVGELLAESPWAKQMRALQALKGVGPVVAATIIEEVGDFSRFAHPRQLVAYFGLALGEHSSGGTARPLGTQMCGSERFGPPPWRRVENGCNMADTQDHAAAPGADELMGAMEPTMPELTTQTPHEADLAQLIVMTLNLEVAPDTIDPQGPLFEDGLGLDSIDILELALAISRTFGVQLRSDDQNNVTIFQSLRSMTNYIQQRRLR
jgi:acyl carrier protein